MSTHDDCTGYNLAAGTATGLRAFNVDKVGRLRGVHHARIWRPGENVAHCGRNYETSPGATESLKPGRCDDADHGCGFWAYHDGSEYATGQIHGVIEGYGKTTVGSKGFRAEKARIVALAIPGKPKPANESRWDRYCRWVDRYHLPLLIACAGSSALAFCLTFLSEGRSTPRLALELLAALVWALSLATIGAGIRGAGMPGRNRFASLMFDEPDRLSDDLAAKVRRNYPDAKFYESVAAMKKAHPVDKALEPNPDNDPNFWDDEPEASLTSSQKLVSIQADMKAYDDALLRQIWRFQ